MPQIPPQRIAYEDGSWEYIFEPSFFDREFLEPEMDELYSAIAGFMQKEAVIVQYPPDQLLNDDWTVHDFLFTKARSHLEKIAMFFRKTQDVRLDIDTMTIVCRHHFFFYTQPVMVLGDNTLRTGLSGIQVLMGLNHPSKPSRSRISTKKESADRPMTTGNMRARITAAALLSKIPTEIMQRVGMAELLDIITEVGNLMRDPKDNKTDTFVQPNREINVDKDFDADLWEQNKTWILKAIAEKGIIIPEEF